MTAHSTRIGVRAAVATLCGIAAIAVAACAAHASSAAAGLPQQRQDTAATGGVPVVVNCTGHDQTRPSQYVLACADGNAYVAGLGWAAWGPAAAFADGTYAFKVCSPSCAAGHLARFPVLAVLWRAEPLPAHPGERYFTRLTIIFTGSRSYGVSGKAYRMPATATYPLSALGGA